MPEELKGTEEENLQNIRKVKNVQVKLHAELGTAKVSVKEAIEFDKGSIVTLDKIENEPIDIFVNEIFIAKGKIVAINDSYGIQIVEIVNKDI